MTDIIQKVGEEAMSAYKAALEVLEEWKFDTNLQFPELTKKVAEKLGITDDSEKKELDGQLRYFVRRNPTYKSKRGAGGGIALAATEAQREATRLAKQKAKEDAAAQVNAQLATATVTATPDSEDVDSEELEIE